LGSATPADDDYLHDTEKFPQQPGLFPSISFRGIINILSLVALIAALLCLFVVYPVIRFYHDNGRNLLITFNARINRTGQAEIVIVNRRSQISFSAPVPLVDSSTPLPARTLKTAQDIAYELVFSDEFTQNGRSFRGDQDPIWEVASGVYDASVINTKNGRLRASPDTFQAHVHDGPRHDNDRCTGKWGWRDGDHDGMYSSSGVLKMRVPLCLSLGAFVEVGLGKGGVLGSWLWKGEEDEGRARRLIYWPGSSDSWSSFNQSETLKMPTNMLSKLNSDSHSGTSLALSIGVPIDDVGDAASEKQVDYVRIYQPIRSSPVEVTEAAIWECAAARNDVMLDVLHAVD